MSDSKELRHDTKADAKDVVTKTGPAGLLLVFYIGAAILGLIVLGIWWWLR